MPLKLNIGLSRKLGLPGYSSLGAACHIEVELDATLLRDPQGFQRHARAAFDACRQAVGDELARHQQQTSDRGMVRGGSAVQPGYDHNGHNGGNGNGYHHSRPGAPGNGNGNGHHNGDRMPARTASPDRPATSAQRRAIESICRKLAIDPAVAADNHHFDLASLTVPHASLLIDQLRRLERGGGDLSGYAGGANVGGVSRRV